MAQLDDGLLPFVVIALIFVLSGNALLRSTPRIARYERPAHRWTIALGMITGFLAIFADLGGMDISSRTFGVSGAIGTGIVVGLAATVILAFLIPIALFLFLYLLAPPIRFLRDRKRAKVLRRRIRAEAKQRQREQQVHLRNAPARQQAEDKKAEAQRRREDARASALLSYSFYSAKLGVRFSRAMFDQYVKDYMGDTHPPEIVERRNKELVSIFEKHLADVQPVKKSSSIESISKWYEETKAQIAALPLDERVKQVRLIDLEKRFDEILAKHLEDTEP